MSTDHLLLTANENLFWLLLAVGVIIIALKLRSKGGKRHRRIPQKVKDYVYKRDHGKCRHCGRHDRYLEYDHIRPFSRGGTNDPSNVQLLCRSCNERKGDRFIG